MGYSLKIGISSVLTLYLHQHVQTRMRELCIIESAKADVSGSTLYTAVLLNNIEYAKIITFHITSKMALVGGAETSNKEVKSLKRHLL